MIDECGKFWAFSSSLPIDQVVTYWCEKTGYKGTKCIEAKKAAIVSACARGEIEFGRSDGKNFSDPPGDLLARGILTIDKASFDAWHDQNFGGVSPLPERPLSTKERNTMLRIIGGLAMAGFGLQIHGRLDGLSDVVKDLSGIGVSVDPDTLGKRLKEAAQLIEPPDGK